MRILTSAVFVLATLACTSANQSAQSSAAKKLAEENSKDVKAGQKVFFGWDDTGIAYVSLAEHACSAVDCDAPPEPPFDLKEFDDACEAQGFKLVKVSCCGYDRCSGLPKQAKSDTNSKSNKDDEEHPELIGKLVYPSLDETQAFKYKGYSSESCATVDCESPDDNAFKAYDAVKTVCEERGFKMIRTGCCSLGACSGNPVKSDGIK